jgi:alkanesulfonate monooxygenase SsuD/methylene tetrahydromethanopterin reductase-like flavin-dependent oxidoreductase (luciferase family)
VCTRLWADEVVEHHGEWFDFPPVAFEPKPVQRPRPPVLVGGESSAALRRAAVLGDGWIGMGHTPESAAAPIASLRRARAASDRADEPMQICLGGTVAGADEVLRWEEAGVTRIIVSPWRRSPEARDGLLRFADTVGLAPRAG